MSIRFDPQARLILVRASVTGPFGTANLRLALDTGATRTVISPARLQAIGVTPNPNNEPIQVTTASGFETAQLVEVRELRALGLTEAPLSVISHHLPSKATFDGMLGLDFLRGRRLTIDFRAGEIHVD